MRALRCLCAAVALSLAGGGAAAQAGGPGVTVFSETIPQPLTLSGDEVAASADVAPTRYTLRASPGGAGQKVTLAGLSVRGLLFAAGVDPDSIKFVSIVRANGSLLALTRADIADPPPFPEGPALFTDRNGTTRFLRPVRDLKGTNAADNIETTNAGPLLVSVDGYASLVVKPSVNRTKVSTGDVVRFSARVRFPPPGAQLSYHWEFGDGTTAEGRQVTHAYATPGGQQAQVTVSGSGGSTAACSSVCGGVAAIDVAVGEPAPQPEAPDATPGSGTGNPQAPGTAGAGPAGQGGSGGGPGTGTVSTPAQAPVAEPRRPRKRKKAVKPARVPSKRPDAAKPPPLPGLRISGVLLSGEVTLPTAKLPQPEPASSPEPGGAPKAPQAARGAGDEPAQLGGSLALAVVAMGLGALRERRRVRLRVE